MVTMFDQEDDLGSLCPAQLSIDVDASHGAWLRDFESGRDFLDFSGTWPGWGLGHGLRDYSWADFVEDILSVSSRTLYFQLNASPRFECKLVEVSSTDFCFWSPSRQPSANDSLSSSTWNIIGADFGAPPEWVSEAWFIETTNALTQKNVPVYFNETKTFLGGQQPLLLASQPWSTSAGSVLSLNGERLLSFTTSSSDCDFDLAEGVNLADFLDGKLIVRSDDESGALQAYFQRILKDILKNVEGLEIVGIRGLSLWCRATSSDLRNAIVNAAYDEGLLVGYSGAATLSLHAPYQVKADAIGRAAAQLEAGLNRTMEKMNRWLK